MCGRFINLNKTSRIEKTFDIIGKTTKKDILSYNVSPSQFTKIITNSKILQLENGKWGYTFLDKKTNSKKNIINSRLESIKNKFLFKDSFEKRKCVVPSNGYFEWSVNENTKKPYFIHVPEAEPIFFAGIWKYINFKENLYKIFSIITKPANIYISDIHHRMPVLLSVEEVFDYLDHKKGNFLNINFKSNIEDYLEYYQISKFVNNPLNNTKECIKPINYL